MVEDSGFAKKRRKKTVKAIREGRKFFKVFLLISLIFSDKIEADFKRRQSLATTSSSTKVIYRMKTNCQTVKSKFHFPQAVIFLLSLEFYPVFTDPLIKRRIIKIKILIIDLINRSFMN